MQVDNKTILKEANAASAKGDYDAFLSHCTDDTEWVYVGEETLRGKEEVKRYMQSTYNDAPQFAEKNLISSEDYVIAIGNITLLNDSKEPVEHSYCDVWRFRDGKIAGLTAFVIRNNGKTELP